MLVPFERFRDKSKQVVAEFNSQILEDLWLYLALRNRKLNIVDLGSPNSQNLEFLSKNYACRIYYASFDQLADDPGSMVGRNGAELFPHGTDFFQPDKRMDLILLWDLLNYVSSKQVGAWFEYLSEFCHNQTVLYAMLPTQNKIPTLPGKFQLLTRSRLRCQFATADRTAHRYETSQLKKIMPGFVVRRSYLLKIGMQECVFKFNGGE